MGWVTPTPLLQQERLEQCLLVSRPVCFRAHACNFVLSLSLSLSLARSLALRLQVTVSEHGMLSSLCLLVATFRAYSGDISVGHLHKWVCMESRHGHGDTWACA